MSVWRVGKPDKMSVFCQKPAKLAVSPPEKPDKMAVFHFGTVFVGRADCQIVRSAVWGLPFCQVGRRVGRIAPSRQSGWWGIIV